MMTAALALVLLMQGEPPPGTGPGPGQGPGPVNPGQSKPPTPQTVPIGGKEKPIGTKTYTDKGLGLAFDYPANWRFERRDKNRPDRFTIPIEGSDGKGELQIIDLDYRAPAEEFQKVQASMSERLSTTVERQYQIELLGVPLLLTQLRAASPDGDRTTLVGLLYANTPRKFNFRLSSLSKDFDAVNLSWQSVLETLRTTSGALPDVAGTKPTPTPVAAVRVVRTEIAARKSPPPTRGPVVVNLKIASSEMALYLPKDWTATPAGEGVVRLSHPKLSKPLMVQGYLTQADNPEAVLARAALRSLDDFGRIDRRYDRQFDATRGGGSASAVWRLGTGPAGAPKSAYDAVYTQDAAFLLLTSEAGDLIAAPVPGTTTPGTTAPGTTAPGAMTPGTVPPGTAPGDAPAGGGSGSLPPMTPVPNPTETPATLPGTLPGTLPATPPATAPATAPAKSVPLTPAERAEKAREERAAAERTQRLAQSFQRSKEEIAILEDLLRTMRLEPASAAPVAPAKPPK